jgi:quinol monooxygenase YgiN
MPVHPPDFPQKGGTVIFSVIGLSPSLKNRGQLLEILRSLVDLTRPCQGCMGCWLAEEDFLRNHVIYAEQWETEEALREHIRSDLYLRLLSAIELSQQPPEVSFYYTAEIKGFNLVETVRMQPSSKG